MEQEKEGRVGADGLRVAIRVRAVETGAEPVRQEGIRRRMRKLGLDAGRAAQSLSATGESEGFRVAGRRRARRFQNWVRRSGCDMMVRCLCVTVLAASPPVFAVTAHAQGLQDRWPTPYQQRQMETPLQQPQSSPAAEPPAARP